MSRANQWRVKSREIAVETAVDLQLPSGMAIRARRPSPMLLASHGKLQATLAAAANPAMLAGGGNTAGMEMVTFMRDLLQYCVVEPRISLTPASAAEIHPVDIPDDDVTYILQWAVRGEEAASLESFRRERPHDIDRSDRAEIRAASEYADGDRRSGPGPEFRLGSDGHITEAETGK